MGTSILELGTRAFRLFRAYLGPDQRMVVDHEVSERVSIDASVDATGVIGPKSWMEAVRVAGRLVAHVRRTMRDDELVALAPHALGGAGNAHAFVDAVRRRFGISVELLSAANSANLAYRAARHDLRAHADRQGTETSEPAGVIYVGDPAIDFVAGNGPSPGFMETSSLGIVRLHRAYGASESGFLPADSSALFSLVRLCAGPACRRLREWGSPTLVLGSENAKAVRTVARSWGYLDEDANDLCRLSLHALVPEILSAPPESLWSLGIDPSRSSLVGTTAVVIDALADLLGQREVRFADCGVAEGAALARLGGPTGFEAPPRRVSDFRLRSGAAASAASAASTGGTASAVSNVNGVGAVATLPGRYIRSTVA